MQSEPDTFTERLKGRIPYRLLTENGTLKFKWLYTGDQLFTRPFFDETISRCLSFPENHPDRMPVTDAAAVVDHAASVDAVTPTAFIYHVSRCGSTLLSQMLACDPRNIVLSEVPLLDELLRMTVHGDPSAAKLFRAVLKLLSVRRSGTEERVFVKTDSWHMLFHEQLATWYAGVPFFMLYRSPKEIGASQAKHPAMHSVPGVIEPSLFGLERADAANMTGDQYLDHVLACYFRAYTKILQSGGTAFALSYHDGPMNMIKQICEVCRFVPDAAVLDAMEKRTQFHSKSPDRNFSGDAPVSFPAGTFTLSEKMFDEFRQLTAGQKMQIHES